MTTATEPSLEQRFKNDLLPQINWETVLNAMGLEPNRKGDHLTSNCPSCGKKECAFYPNEAKGDPRFYCSRREKCGYEEHILAHINGGQFPTGDDWIKAVQELANLAGLSFELSERKYAGKTAKTTSKNVLKDYWEWLQSRFQNSPAEKYLKGRGLNPSGSPFGYFPEKIDEVLEWAKKKGYSKQELLDCFIIKDKGNGEFPVMYGRLAGAFIDQRGNIHNIWGRDLTGKCEKKYKYLNLDNSELAHKKSPYGADQFKRGSVFWVEGYLDVAASKECGYVSVASGTASIPQDMVDSIKGIDALVIALDKDGAGGDGAFKFIEKNANSNMKLYTINHELMRGCKDTAELYQKHGKEAVDQVFHPDNLEHPFSFAARHILKKNRPENGWSPVAKEKAMEEAVAFDKKVNEPSKMPMLRECFWKNGIEKELELDEISIDAMLDSMDEKKKQAQLREQIKSNLDKAVEKAKEGDFEGVAAISKKINESVLSSSDKSTDTPTKFISDFGDDWLNKEPPEKEMLLCFTNKSGKPQGFLPKGIVAMLAGAGGVGKSHLVTQIAISIITKKPLFGDYYPSKSGAVFLGMGENSIDDIRRIIWKNSKGLNPQEKALLSKHLAIRSFHGIDAAFLDEYGKPSRFYYKLKEELIRTAPAEGWSLLIFDPASRLMGVDAEKDNALATRFISLLEELTEELPGNPTVLFAHHVNKSALNQNEEEQNQSAARGASALTDGCRLQMNLFKKGKENKYTISMPKTNFTAIIDPISLEKDENGVLVLSKEQKNIPKPHSY